MADIAKPQVGKRGWNTLVDALFDRVNEHERKFSFLTATGDGITDDTAAINAQLAALPAGAYVRGAPGSTYRISAPIVLRPGGRMTLDLTGCTVTVAPGTPAFNLLRNAAVAPTATVPAVTATAGSSALTSAGGFTSAMNGKQVGVPGGGINAFSASGAAYGTFVYTDASNAALAPVVQARTTSVIRARTTVTATMQVFDRDRDITLIGGTWDRTGVGVAADGNNQHTLFLRRVDGLTIRGPMRFISTAGKYAIAAGDVSQVDATELRFNTASDGIHFIGPVRAVEVRNVGGTTGDDLVAFTAADYGLYSDVSGDMVDIITDGAHSDNAKAAYKTIGGTGLAITGMVVRNISGITWTHCVAIVDDFTGATDVSCRLENISVRTTDDTRPVLDISPSLGGTIEVNGIELHVTSGRTGSGPMMLVRSPGNIQHLAIRNVTLGTSANSSTWYALQINAGSGVVDYIELAGWRYKNPSGNSHYPVQLHTQVNRLLARDMRLESLKALIWQDISFTLRLITEGLTIFNSEYGVIDTAGSLEWTYSASYVDCFTAYLRTRTSGTNVPVALRGSGLWGFRTPTANGWGRAGLTGTLAARVLDRTLPTDVSLLARNMGDEAYNTNAALACGAGPVICDGTSWKHLYSGVTYT